MGKKIIITGATGLIGKGLCERLISGGNEITIFTSNTGKAESTIPGAKEYIKWNYNKPEEWSGYIDGKDAVVHLAGAGIAAKRWSADYKKLILDSREASTRMIAEAIISAHNKPEVFISSSATGFYGSAGDEILVEDSKSGTDFLSEVCRRWEEPAKAVKSYGIRMVNIRTGIVLSRKGGALEKMVMPFKFFVGGHLGNGKQWFPWIHINDIINIYMYCLNNNSISGPVNAGAPNPLRASEFAKIIGAVIKRPAIFPVPLFTLKIAIGEAAESLIASQRVIPKKLLDSGFKFEFENADNALKDLL